MEHVVVLQVSEQADSQEEERDKVFSSEYFDFNFEHFVVLQVSEQADRQEEGQSIFI